MTANEQNVRHDGSDPIPRSSGGTRAGWGRTVTVGAALALVAGLSGCGAGQVAQTAHQVTATGGAEARQGSILVRDVQIAYDRPIPGDTVYEPGDDATLQATVVNDGTAADRLVAVSSPIATSGRVVGDARVPDGHVLTAGYDEPISSITLPGATAVDITLEGLLAPIRAGMTYPVVLTFARAGDILVEVPVENPDVLPPRARDEPHGGDVAQAGPQAPPVLRPGN